jgi:hypothetical protein
MKKMLLVVFLVVLLAANIFAADNSDVGIGTAFRSIYGFGLGLLLKTPVLPMHWGMNIGLSEDLAKNYNRYLSISMTGDWHFMDSKKLSEIMGRRFSEIERFGWFMGLGIQWGFIFSDEYTGIEKIGLGGRVPFGLYFKPIEKLELLFDVAPSLGMYIQNYDVSPNFAIGWTVGFRYWL